jgi:hypothetical protein
MSIWNGIKKALNTDLTTPLNTLITTARTTITTAISGVDTKVTTTNTNLGAQADAANPAGSANAKMAALLRRWAVASETVQASSAASKVGKSVTKSLMSLVGGTVRIKFTAYSNGGTWTLTYGPGFGGGAVTLGSGSNTSGQAFSVDVKVPPGGLIILTGSATNDANIYLSNVSVCFSVSSDQTPLATSLID